MIGKTTEIAAANIVARTRLPDCIPQTTLGDGQFCCYGYLGFRADAIKFYILKTKRKLFVCYEGTHSTKLSIFEICRVNKLHAE
jgi:hypothetical protein